MKQNNCRMCKSNNLKKFLSTKDYYFYKDLVKNFRFNSKI